MGGTIPGDIFTTTTSALLFTFNGEGWIIPANTFVSSQQAFGVFSDQVGSSLINSGTVFGGFHGVVFNSASSGGAITNNAAGTIVGHLQGVSLSGLDETLTNHGAVWGLVDDGVHLGAGGATVVNDGEIRGAEAGIEVQAAGAAIRNSGLVRSNLDGILVDTGAGLTDIDNFAAGTITGFSFAIHTVSGAISLDNRGTIAGTILCEGANANDTVVNKGTITGLVILRAGNDTFNGAGGASSNVFGGTGNDTLIGGNSNDTLDGGAGLDFISGGRGKDSLFGGTERDIFDFNSVKDSLPGSKRDVINDFNRGTDDIDLKDIDAKKGVGGNNTFKWIGGQDFHDKKGELRYEDKGAKVIVQGDVNGDGKADFEILVKVGALSSGDFLL